MKHLCINNIIRKDQVDTLSSLTSTGTKPSLTYDWSYLYNPKGHPHAPVHIGERTFTYDADGNQLGWTDDKNATYRTITWDDADRIEAIDDHGQVSTYGYDNNGQREINQTKQNLVVYVNQFFTERNGSIGSKNIFVGNTRIVTKVTGGTLFIRSFDGSGGGGQGSPGQGSASGNGNGGSSSNGNAQANGQSHGDNGKHLGQQKNGNNGNGGSNGQGNGGDNGNGNGHRNGNANSSNGNGQGNGNANANGADNGNAANAGQDNGKENGNSQSNGNGNSQDNGNSGQGHNAGTAGLNGLAHRSAQADAVAQNTCKNKHRAPIYCSDGSGSSGSGNGNGNGNGAGSGNGNGQVVKISSGEQLFYYHSDHLGSTGFVTRENGVIHEHVE